MRARDPSGTALAYMTSLVTDMTSLVTPGAVRGQLVTAHLVSGPRR